MTEVKDMSGYDRLVINKKGVGAKWNLQACLEIQEAFDNGYRFVETGSRRDQPCLNYRGNSVMVVMFKEKDTFKDNNKAPEPATSKDEGKVEGDSKVAEKSPETVTEPTTQETKPKKKAGRPSKKSKSE